MGEDCLELLPIEVEARLKVWMTVQLECQSLPEHRLNKLIPMQQDLDKGCLVSLRQMPLSVETCLDSPVPIPQLEACLDSQVPIRVETCLDRVQHPQTLLQDCLDSPVPTVIFLVRSLMQIADNSKLEPQ